MQNPFCQIENPLLLSTILLASIIAGGVLGSCLGQAARHHAFGLIIGLASGALVGLLIYKNRHDLVACSEASRPESS